MCVSKNGVTIGDNWRNETRDKSGLAQPAIDFKLENESTINFKSNNLDAIDDRESMQRQSDSYCWRWYKFYEVFTVLRVKWLQRCRNSPWCGFI
jgi:hypothetical protein